MGQKVNPTGFRLGVNPHVSWASRWYGHKKNFASLLHEDRQIRDYLDKQTENVGVKVIIDRMPLYIHITLITHKPGVLIGKKGQKTEQFNRDISKIAGGKPIKCEIKQEKQPNLSACILAYSIGDNLQKRVTCRKAMIYASREAIKAGALGVKIQISGRIGGAEIARTEWHKEGKLSLNTLRNYIDYYQHAVTTKSGILGIKVWIFKPS